MIYKLTLQPDLRNIVGSGHRKSRKYKLSDPVLPPRISLVCRQIRTEVTLDTLRRVNFAVGALTQDDLVSQAKATAEQPRRIRHYEIHVELTYLPHLITIEVLTYQLCHILHILLHCHKEHLLKQTSRHSNTLSVLYKPSPTVIVSDEEELTFRCDFEKDGTIVRATKMRGSLARRLAPHVSHIIRVTFDRLE